MRQLAILCALVPFLLLGLVGRAVSQPATISGRVVDKQGRPVAYANVFASSDSLARRSLTYTASKENGAFTLPLAEGIEGSVWITVRSMGYSVFRKRYSLQTIPSPLRVVMAEETIGIEGVRVVADAKNMYAQGDTLIYSTGYYTKGNERNIGEVIRKMPGMEVSRSGQLSFQGKQIDKILVNGKDLLSSSTGTTLNTLPADFAQSVEVIKDYQDGDVANRYRAERQMALNLKAKHPIKLNGYVEGGGGVVERFNGKASLIGLMGDMSVSALTNANNIGLPTFTLSDYLANVVGKEDLLGGGKVRASVLSFTPEEEELVVSPKDEYARLSGMGNVNFTWLPAKGYRLKSNTIYTQSTARRFYQSKDAYQLAGGIVELMEERRGRLGSLLVSQRISQRWIPNAQFSLRADTKFNLRQYRTSIDRDRASGLEQLSVADRGKRISLEVGQTLEVNRQVGTGLFTAGANFSWEASRQGGDYSMSTPTLPIAADIGTDAARPYRYGYSRRATPWDWEAYVRFDHPLLWGVHAVGELSYQQSTESQRVYVPRFVDSHERLLWHSPKAYVGFMKNLGILRFSLGSYFAYYRMLQGQQEGKEAFRMEPKFLLELNMSDFHSFTLSVERTTEKAGLYSFSRIGWLAGYKEIYTPSYCSNPFGKGTEAVLTYNYLNLLSNVMVFGHAFYSRTDDGSLLATDAATENLTTRHYEDGGKESQLQASLSATIGLGNWPLDVSMKGTYDYVGSQAKYQGRVVDITTGNTVGYLGLLSRLYDSPIDFEVGATYTYQDNRISGRSRNAWYQDWLGRAAAYLAVGRFSLSLAGKGIWVRSSSYTQRFLDFDSSASYKWEHLELKASVENALHLRKREWVEESLSEVLHSTAVYRKMPGYVLLSLVWSF